MPTTIKCPSCANEFPLEEAVSEEYKKELREQMMLYKKQKEEELSRKEQEWQQQLQKREAELSKQMQLDKQKMQEQLQESLRREISGDFQNQLQLLQENNKDIEEKLKHARQKELDFMKK